MFQVIKNKSSLQILTLQNNDKISNFDENVIFSEKLKFDTGMSVYKLRQNQKSDSRSTILKHEDN